MKTRRFAWLLCCLSLTLGLTTHHVVSAADDPGSKAEVDAIDEGHDDHATDGEADPTANNPLSINVDLAIVTLIVFVVLFAVLWKFAWGPISEALDGRERQVADNIANAEQRHEEAKKLLAEHQATLADASEEVRQMIEGAKKEAEAQKQQIVAEAQAAATAEKDRAVREITAAKTAALQSMAETSVDTAVDLAGRIVNRQLSADDHAEMIRESLQQFPSEN